MKQRGKWCARMWLVAGLCLVKPAARGAEARFAVWQCADPPEGAVAGRRIVMEAPVDTVYSVDLVLSFSPASASLGTIQKGALADGMWLVKNSPGAGIVRVALAGASPIGGAGNLVIIPFLDSPDVLVEIQSVSVNEGGLTAGFAANTAPTLAVVADQTLASGATLSLALTATDADLPPQSLRFELQAGPADMTVAATTGQLNWTPGAGLPAGDYPVMAKVTDIGDPPRADTTSFNVHLDAAVVGRRLFYNQSAWDGNDPAANAADDDAIAPDKQALPPGGTASFANYSSYHRGINGLMVDIAGLPGTPAADDFIFKRGNDATPGDWETAPAPDTITVRGGAGIGGSDRVTLTWGANAVTKQWLQVTVRATTATGLQQPDVFYFGNAVGEVGNSATDAIVDTTDVLQPFYQQTPVGQAPLDSPYDINRDRTVDTTDVLLPFYHQTGGTEVLQLIALNTGLSLAVSASAVRLSAVEMQELLKNGITAHPSQDPGTEGTIGERRRRLLVWRVDGQTLFLGLADQEDNPVLIGSDAVGQSEWRRIAARRGEYQGQTGWLIRIESDCRSKFFRIRQGDESKAAAGFVADSNRDVEPNAEH